MKGKREKVFLIVTKQYLCALLEQLLLKRDGDMMMVLVMVVMVMMVMVMMVMVMMVMVRKERESVPACKAAGGNWAVPASSTESSCTGSCQPRGASNALKVQANYFPGWETIPMHLVVSKWVILLVLLHPILSTQRRRPPPMHSKPIISQDEIWRVASLLPFCN